MAMSIEEQRRLMLIKEHQIVADDIFKMLERYFQNEKLLDSKDIFRKDNETIRLRYDNRLYLIEATYNKNEGYGQLVVFKADRGEEFNPEPNFIPKNNSLIFFDKLGNISIGNMVSHPNPENCAEDLINEIKK